MPMTIAEKKAESNAYFAKKEKNHFSYYQSTKYPLIYRNSYWGGCSGDIPTKTILENRNNFIEKYNISDYRPYSTLSHKMIKKTHIFYDDNYNKKTPPKDLHKHYFQWDAGMSKDHKEYYTIKGTYGKSIIVLFSQFKHDHLHNVILEHEYFEVPPLYNEGLTTYIKIIHPYTL